MSQKVWERENPERCAWLMRATDIPPPLATSLFLSLFISINLCISLSPLIFLLYSLFYMLLLSTEVKSMRYIILLLFHTSFSRSFPFGWISCTPSAFPDTENKASSIHLDATTPPPLVCASEAPYMICMCEHPHKTRAIPKFPAICFGNRTKLFLESKAKCFFLPVSALLIILMS